MNPRELATVLAALRYWREENTSAYGETLQERARELMPDHFEDQEPLEVREIDALCERLNGANGDVIIFPNKVDWRLLRKQKNSMARAIGDIKGQLGKRSKEDLQGILHLIDAIQDQAAEQLGEQAVFGAL